MKVELIEHMGSDISVVNAARVSFANKSELDFKINPESKILEISLKDKDAKLIKYLAKHKHVLPFRHPQVTLHVKAPLFVMRQLGKHQVGMSWSEISRRYVDSEPEFYKPAVWRERAANKKQGSSDTTIETLAWTDTWTGEHQIQGIGEQYENLCMYAYEMYKLMLKNEVAPEQARMILPQSMYTEAIWTGSLLSFFHVWKLRAAPDAQREVQEIANQIEAIIEPLYPASWAALKEFA